MKKILIYICVILLLFITGCNTPTPPEGPNEGEGGGNEVENDDKKDEEDDGPKEDTYQIKHSTLLLLDIENNYIELLNLSATQLTENTKIYKLNNETKESASYDDLYVGMNNIYVKTKNETEVLEILIDNETIFNRIRVAIRQTISNISDINTLYHDSVSIYISSPTTIKTYDGKEEYKVKANTSLTFFIKNNEIVFYNGKVLNKSTKRLIIEQSEKPIQITSISRGSNTQYEGNIELSIKDNRLLVINDILMEEYLKKVVPSEMPSSWNMEALKSQAVAARTYAYKEFYNKKFQSFGYIVDDSESSQVYNNSNDQSSTNQAVLETKGITMFCEGEAIIAYYYSSSSGLCGKGNEVWITNKVIEDILYLQGGNTTNKEVDTSSEESLLQFYKTINMDSPSGNSSNFRWKIGMTKEQLRNTLNVNIPLMYKGNEESYLVLKNNEWVVEEIPADIGEIKNVFVSERGTSGVVISLQVEAENVTFRIYNQYNIRFTVRPKDCGSDVIRYNTKANTGDYTSSSKNPSILTSGYFALEWQGDTLNFYGGGSGHGVGMCQYSANSYAASGKTYQEILNIFYKNIDFIDTSKQYTPLSDYEKYFK